jgi:hypothetical protein
MRREAADKNSTTYFELILLQLRKSRITISLKQPPSSLKLHNLQNCVQRYGTPNIGKIANLPLRFGSINSNAFYIVQNFITSITLNLIIHYIETTPVRTIPKRSSAEGGITTEIAPSQNNRRVRTRTVIALFNFQRDVECLH